MPDATIAWLCSDATYNIEAIYNTVQQKFKDTFKAKSTVYNIIKRYSAQLFCKNNNAYPTQLYYESLTIS